MWRVCVNYVIYNCIINKTRFMFSYGILWWTQRDLIFKWHVDITFVNYVTTFLFPCKTLWWTKWLNFTFPLSCRNVHICVNIFEDVNDLFLPKRSENDKFLKKKMQREYAKFIRFFFYSTLVKDVSCTVIGQSNFGLQTALVISVNLSGLTERERKVVVAGDFRKSLFGSQV